ncbi:hypothetical protein D8674_022601 [Pyrus ussuriensis x Pyrus communis]|uniref:Uncharacterized protein n=1 Tax=Pyrus ussuriensis x Pyrus communis TaxID=2448454 RepID=A0A5N5GMI8_9ROSA|nr:hypothetical protein D8674_022601 [Pyrus ussuriensis x Pyrus communis]
MGGEERADPPAPKVLRLLYFVGAGLSSARCSASPWLYSNSSSSPKMLQMPLSDVRFLFEILAECVKQ